MERLACYSRLGCFLSRPSPFLHSFRRFFSHFVRRSPPLLVSHASGPPFLASFVTPVLVLRPHSLVTKGV